MIIVFYLGFLLVIILLWFVWDRGVIIVEKLVRIDRIKILYYYYNMFVFYGIM